MKVCVDKKCMIEAEKKALEGGETQESLIRAVAEGIVNNKEFTKMLSECREAPILLLIGRGSNGLDGLALGCELLRRGRNVAACRLSGGKETPLSCLFFDEFSLHGGFLIQSDHIAQHEWSMIIDALLGTGGRRMQDEELSGIIQEVNSIPVPIVAIDIPSGIDPDTGEIWDQAIAADCTFACQAPKVGSFFLDAWDQVGTLHTVDIGLTGLSSYISYIEPHDAAKCLPSLKRSAHKYSRGLVHLFSGSKEMMGAASLTALAAFLSGAGYVRSYIPQNASTESLMLPKEAVRVFYAPEEQLSSFAHLEKGVVIAGPGLGRGKHTETLVRSLIEGTNIPLVFDGDALTCMPKEFLTSSRLERAILTPHRKEAEILFGFSCQNLTAQLIEKIQKIASSSSSYIILKGAPTVIFAPTGEVEVMGFGVPAMATAGSGDVLTGILGALLAQGLSRKAACRLGTVLHAFSAQVAAEKYSSYCVQAHHLIKYLPSGFKRLLAMRGMVFQTHVPPRLKNC